jgi:uncharacterized protein YjbI with pentapeptide repeats
VDLQEADLRGADLSSANLEGALMAGSEVAARQAAVAIRRPLLRERVGLQSDDDCNDHHQSPVVRAR